MTARADTRRRLGEKIGRFPSSPGVYIMKDGRERILYVGKAVNLRSRVRSYFSGSPDTRVFVKHLLRRVEDVACIVTASETEALILENNLIKKHRPLFNVRLRDDKTYVCIKVTLAEKWPRVLVTRRYQNDGNLYFGPYGSAGSVREMLRVIKTVFPLRTCSNGFFNSRRRPCIEYDIGRCSAPCVDYISEEKYREDVEEVILFLRGKNSELMEILGRKMRGASRQRRFELAARYRDQIRAIERVFEVQKAQGLGGGDTDVFALVREGETAGIQELVIREGKIQNSHCHTFESTLEPEEIIASFLTQYYLADRYVPRRILCDTDFPERPLLADWLRERRGGAVEIAVPRRGEKRRLVEMARENARNAFRLARSKAERLRETLHSLRMSLDLPELPRRIECYDISNFQGAQTVASMVVFQDGEPDRNHYRKFRIRGVEGADDFRSMREVLERRLRRVADDLDAPPDLLVIDGGKGQLAVATEVLRSLGQERIAVVGLAKERRSRGTTERVFVPGRSSPLPLPQDSPESLLLQQIRDEAHRFAVRYHRELRRRRTLETGLEAIPGVGAKRQRALVERFGTLEEIRQASEESLREVVGPRTATAIYEHFNAPRDETI